MGKEIYDVKADGRWEKPFIDEEATRERELPGGEKITYHYVHGGFQDTAVKFVLCLPLKENYTGRFFQYLSPFPGPDEEVASFPLTGEDDRIGFALSHGAYYVESNMGSAASFGPSPDPQLVWKSSAAVAEYSRIFAMEYYGCDRPYGYVHGGSGGGYKTMACVENSDAWDGAVPFVIGSPYSLPNTITMHVQGQRALRHVFPQIIDALDAGGSGDMYAGLNEDEAAMLKELTLMGYPPQAWFLEAEGIMDPGSLPVLTPGVKATDPTYFQDFWTKEGYLGTDPKSSAVKDRLVFTTKVVGVHIPGANEKTEKADLNDVDGAWKKSLADGKGYWIEVEELPQGEDLYLEGVNITFETGEAQGQPLLLGGMKAKENGAGGYLSLGMCFGMDDLDGVLGKVQPGDVLKLDNSDYIAIQSYYRHQVPDDLTAHAWDQFRDANGKPAIPQRDFVMGPGFCGTGTVQDGNIHCKVINIQSLMDESTCPWCADWYRQQIIKSKGSEDDFRVYYMERCMHGNVSLVRSNMVVNYLGALNQAMLDVSDWVERGIEPAPSTVYQYQEGQIIPEPNANTRLGMQPTIILTANGKACAKVKPGEPVTFQAQAMCPPNAGEITYLDFDFEADNIVAMDKPVDNKFATKGQVVPTQIAGCLGATAEVTHTYDKPGIYFASVEVRQNRTGDPTDPFTQIRNLSRARVIVEA